MVIIARLFPSFCKFDFSNKRNLRDERCSRGAKEGDEDEEDDGFVGESPLEEQNSCNDNGNAESSGSGSGAGAGPGEELDN